MFRKIICTFWALAAVVMLRLPAAAEEGSIRILPDCAGCSVTGGLVTLYRVGEPEAGGYRVSDGLADWTVWQREVQTEEVMQWLLKQERSGGVTEAAADEQGVVFSELSAGLYLAVQTEPAAGYFPFSPFLVTIPEKNKWEIVKYPPVVRDAEIPDTSDRPAPIIGAMALGFIITVLMLMVDKGKK